MKNIIAKQCDQPATMVVCLTAWMRGSVLDGNAGGKF